MTRAAERLIVAGFHGARGKARDCWYDMARTGLDGAMDQSPSPWSADEKIWRLGEAWRATEGARAEAVGEQGQAPPWLWVRAAPERTAAAFSPSRAIAAPFRTGPQAARESRLAAGRLSHSLLQYLPDIAAEQRRDAGLRFLAKRGAAAPVEEHGAIVERVLAVIDDKRLATLFGPGSRAEVAVGVNLPRPGRPPTPFAGRIDRLAVSEECVWVADFKSGAAGGEAPLQYLAQLALYRAALAPLYPELPLRPFLIWLGNVDIVEIGHGALDQALAKLLASM